MTVEEINNEESQFEIDFPKYEDYIIVNDLSYLYVTRPYTTYEEDGNISQVPYDISLQNCKYNVKENKIISEFYFGDEENTKFRLAFELRNKPTKEFTQDTQITKVDVFSVDDKKYNKNPYVIYFDYINKKIKDLRTSVRRFEITTDKGNVFNADVSRTILTVI
ncbi:hypothetical protein BCR32DRAFT_328397, partial [Anaeromyces robustus]